MQRANNVSIALARLRVEDERGETRAPAHEALARAAASGNSRGALDADTVAALLAAAPTEEETRAFTRAFPTTDDSDDSLASLPDPERFLCLMARVPRVREKLAAAAFVAEFDETAGSVAAALETVRVACDEVRRSKQLKAVLAAALAAGNVLNEGTPRGDAAGFTLDSLHKLADVKCAGRARDDGAAAERGFGGSLLDFVVAAADARLKGRGVVFGFGFVDVEAENDDEDEDSNEISSRFSLAAELGACEAASRWSRADLASALARVELGARHAAAEAEGARDAAAALERSRGVTLNPPDALVDLRRCEATFARFVDDSKPRRRALSALAEYVDEKFHALCAYVGEGGGDGTRAESARPETQKETGPGRDVSELFGGLWAFAASVDAARERRLARAAEARAAKKDRRDGESGDA